MHLSGRVFLRALLISSLLASSPLALAAEPTPPRYNAVTLQAEVQREVPNDLLNATLYVEINDATPAGVADAVNRRVNDALRVAREHKDVRARSGNNQTYPVYSKGNQLQGWRGRGEIRLESRNFEAASALIGKLQASMQLGGIQFTVAPESRRTAENELITEAIAAFKARAEILKSALGGRGYKLQQLNVSTGHAAPPPRFAVARAAPATQDVAPPSFEAGLSVVSVSANGTIELLE